MPNAFGVEHTPINKRFFSEKARKKDAKQGDALPDGSFPIKNRHDLANAKRLVGHSKHPEAAEALIERKEKEFSKAFGGLIATKNGRRKAEQEREAALNAGKVYEPKSGTYVSKSVKEGLEMVANAGKMPSRTHMTGGGKKPTSALISRLKKPQIPAQRKPAKIDNTSAESVS